MFFGPLGKSGLSQFFDIFESAFVFMHGAVLLEKGEEFFCCSGWCWKWVAEILVCWCDRGSVRFAGTSLVPPRIQGKVWMLHWCHGISNFDFEFQAEWRANTVKP